ncbi:hypothetical protein ACMFMG_002021 [Clarireedia jacksonii]
MCSTLTNSFAQGLCYDYSNTYDLNQIAGYSTLPLCVTSFLSYGIQDNTVCGISGKGTETAYASCLCSTSFSEHLFSISSSVHQFCDQSTPYPSEIASSIVEQYCFTLAGGFVTTIDGSATTVVSTPNTYIASATSTSSVSVSKATDTVTITACPVSTAAILKARAYERSVDARYSNNAGVEKRCGRGYDAVIVLLLLHLLVWIVGFGWLFKQKRASRAGSCRHADTTMTMKNSFEEYKDGSEKAVQST